MPRIPTFSNDVTVRPGGAAQASPSAMGAPGEAGARAGAEVSDVMAQFQARYAEAARAADASHYTAQASQTLGDLQHKWSLVPDRAQAEAGFNQDAATARKQLLDGISDPLVKMHVGQSYDGETIARRYDTANAAFRLESNTRVAQIDADNNTAANAAAGASNDALRAKLIDDRVGAIKGAVAAGWLQPVQGEQMEIQFRSQVQEVQARALTNQVIDAQDGRAAHALAERLDDTTQFPGLLPERREILQQRLETLGYRLDVRAAAKVAHDDSVADRKLSRAQAHNEATLLAAIGAGNSNLSASDIQHLADTQQISAAGVEALTNARNRAEDGRDDPKRALGLWHAIGTGAASSQDITDALGQGLISKSTSVTMMRAIDSATNRKEAGEAKSAFEQMKTVLRGGGVEQGLFPDKSPIVAMWAQAQGEWHDRVTIGGEDPQAVKADILKRLAPDTVAPTWLKQPKAGAVQSPQDLQNTITKTGQLHKAGKMSDADYNSELKLLSQYKAFYGLQAQKQPAKPAASGARP